MSGVKLGGRESDLTANYSGVWFGHHGVRDKTGDGPTGREWVLAIVARALWYSVL